MQVELFVIDTAIYTPEIDVMVSRLNFNNIFTFNLRY